MTSVAEANPMPLVVVVAEDEALIRMMAVDALTEAGFAVVEAGHAEDALAVLAAQSNDIHVLFTDIHMPGSMNGLELTHHVRDHWPWIALIVASGKARPLAAELPEGGACKVVGWSRQAANCVISSLPFHRRGTHSITPAPHNFACSRRSLPPSCRGGCQPKGRTGERGSRAGRQARREGR